MQTDTNNTQMWAQEEVKELPDTPDTARWLPDTHPRAAPDTPDTARRLHYHFKMCELKSCCTQDKP